MTVIAMTREMGTRGKDVALAVAERLDLEIIHHEIVEKSLADKLKMSENSVHRFLEGEASLWERWKVDRRRLSRYSAEEILDLVTRGRVVIRGWGAAQLLRTVDHVVRVRVCAPMSARVAEMMERLGLDDPKLARAEIRRSDGAHDALIRNRFNIDWTDPTGYALTLNTAEMTIETAADLICQLAQSPAHAETEASREVLNDVLVGERVRSAIEDRTQLGALAESIQVTTRNGVVTLKGLVSTGTDIGGLIETVEGVRGVNSVVNEIQEIPLGSAAFGA